MEEQIPWSNERPRLEASTLSLSAITTFYNYHEITRVV